MRPSPLVENCDLQWPQCRRTRAWRERGILVPRPEELGWESVLFAYEVFPARHPSVVARFARLYQPLARQLLLVEYPHEL